MKRLSDFMFKVSTGWITLVSLVIFVGFTVIVLPRQTGENAVTSGDSRSPDLSFIYSSEDLYSMAQTYGEEGRDAYIRARYTFDIAWPIVYTLFLSTSISWLFNSALSPQTWLRRLNLLPLVGMLLDYLENIAASIVMFRFPMRTPIVDILAPIFTSLKWMTITGAFILLFIVLLVILWKSTFGRKT